MSKEKLTANREQLSVIIAGVLVAKSCGVVFSDGEHPSNGKCWGSLRILLDLGTSKVDVDLMVNDFNWKVSVAGTETYSRTGGKHSLTAEKIMTVINDLIDELFPAEIAQAA